MILLYKRPYNYYLQLPYLLDRFIYSLNIDRETCLLCPRLKRSAHAGCYSAVGLPLFENSSIVEQPLDLWTLTERYKSAAVRIIQNAR